MKKTVVLLLLSLTMVTAQVDRSQQPQAEFTPEIKITLPYTFKLKNGLKVYLVENHKLPRVSMSLRMDNPLTLEDDTTGATSIMGVMLGNGTKTISKDRFNSRVEYLGATISFSSQSGWADCLSRYFPEILGLFADAAINPVFDPEEFEKERNKRIEEIKNSEKNISAISSRVNSILVYGENHPYGEYETVKKLKKLRLGDIITSYYTRFVPTNAYLVVEGDMDMKSAKKLIKKHFKSWKYRRVLESNIPSPKNASVSEINAVNVSNAVQSKITVENLVTVQKKDSDFFPLQIANYLLGSTQGYLFENLREDKGYTYGAYSSVNFNKKTKGDFKAYASVRTQVTDSAVVEFLKEIKRIREEPVTEEMLKDAKAKYTGSFIMSMENPKTMASFAVNIAIENLPKDFYNTYLQKVEAVTVKDIQRVAQKYFLINKLKIIVVGDLGSITERMENIYFDEQRIPIKYFDKYGHPTSSPNAGELSIPEGVTLQSVLSKYIDAIGGKEKLEKINSLYVRSKAEMNKAPLSLEIRKYKGEQQSIVFKMMDNVVSKQIYNGQKGYTESQGQKQLMAGATLESFKFHLPIFAELDLLNNEKAELKNIIYIGDKKAYQVTVGEANKLFYDTETGLKIKEESTITENGQTIKDELSFSNYKDFEAGIKMPNKMSFITGDSPELEFTVEDVKINKGVSSEDFK